MNKLLLFLFVSTLTQYALGEKEEPFQSRFIVTTDINGNLRVDDLLAPSTYASVSIDDITLYLYTRENGENPFEIKPSNNMTDLMNTDYDSKKLNVFLIHGLNNDYTSDFNKEVKAALLEKFDVNVFAVDWHGPAGALYPSAVEAVPDTGNIVGEFIKLMFESFNLSGKDFRLIGHSLGAHVVGAAGSVVDGEIEYIVGLDPARPLFYEDKPESRLDKTDAKFLEVIHTNAGNLGYVESMGHVDFFPNGGRLQPGCKIDLFGSCAHSRSYLYFAESIKTSNFIATKCESYDDFEDGKCDENETALMGEFEIDYKLRGDYYLDTAGEEPYALGTQHQKLIKFSFDKC